MLCHIFNLLLTPIYLPLHLETPQPPDQLGKIIVDLVKNGPRAVSSCCSFLEWGSYHHSFPHCQQAFRFGRCDFCFSSRRRGFGDLRLFANINLLWIVRNKNRDSWEKMLATLRISYRKEQYTIYPSYLSKVDLASLLTTPVCLSKSTIMIMFFVRNPVLMSAWLILWCGSIHQFADDVLDVSRKYKKCEWMPHGTTTTTAREGAVPKSAVCQVPCLQYRMMRRIRRRKILPIWIPKEKRLFGDATSCWRRYCSFDLFQESKLDFK